MEKRPTILVTNDDGYMAKGLQTLASLMQQIGKVVVVFGDLLLIVLYLL